MWQATLTASLWVREWVLGCKMGEVGGEGVALLRKEVSLMVG